MLVLFIKASIFPYRSIGNSAYYKYFLKLLAVTATLKAKSVAKGKMTKVGCRLKGSAR